jgi:hypothetical protein
MNAEFDMQEVLQSFYAGGQLLNDFPCFRAQIFSADARNVMFNLFEF